MPNSTTLKAFICKSFICGTTVKVLIHIKYVKNANHVGIVGNSKRTRKNIPENIKTYSSWKSQRIFQQKAKNNQMVDATTITSNDRTIRPTLSRVEIQNNYIGDKEVITMSPTTMLKVNEMKISCNTIKKIL